MTDSIRIDESNEGDEIAVSSDVTDVVTADVSSVVNSEETSSSTSNSGSRDSFSTGLLKRSSKAKWTCDRLKIRHMTHTRNGWIFQVRSPAILSISSKLPMLRARVGHHGMSDARNIGRFLGNLADRLFAQASSSRISLMMIDQNIDDQQRLDAIEAHIFATEDDRRARVDALRLPHHEYVHPDAADLDLVSTQEFQRRLESALADRVKEGFALGVRQIRAGGFKEPTEECRFVANACERLDAAISTLSETPALRGLGSVDTAVSALEEEAQAIISNNEHNKIRALVSAGAECEGADSVVSNSPAVFLAMAQDLGHCGMVSNGLVPKQLLEEARNERAAGRSMPDPVCIAEHTPLQALNSAVTQDAPSGHATGLQTRPDAQINLSAAAHQPNEEPVAAVEIAVTAVAETATPQFMGEDDPRYVARTPSAHPPLSTALLEYVNMKLKVLSIPSIKKISDLDEVDNTRHKSIRDLKSKAHRADLFMELIGDHPYDTYNGCDFQTFVNMLLYLPPNHAKCKIFQGMSTHEILLDHVDPVDGSSTSKPMSLSTVKNGYVNGVSSVLMWFAKKYISIRRKNGERDARFISPLDGGDLEFAPVFRARRPSHPISSKKMARVLETGAQRARLSTCILPLLACFTGRRLGMLISLRGSDIVAKFSTQDPGGPNPQDIFVAQPNMMQRQNGRWIAAPLKTDESEHYFALHRFLDQIGFTKWAQSLGDELIFKHFYNSDNPSSYASKSMNKLLKECGCVDREVFHAIRSVRIDYMRDLNVTAQTIRQQAGHAPADEHERYGSQLLTEARCRQLWDLEIPSYLEHVQHLFENLDFDAMREADMQAFARD